MKDYSNNFAFDIGITSIGAAAIADKDLNYLGVRMFRQAEEAKDSRLHRSARRNTARKKWRKKQLRKAFSDFDIIPAEDFAIEGFGSFTAAPEGFNKPQDKTVYHLRKRALSEQVTDRELHLCLLNMLQARGHFNMEMYDLSKQTVTFDEYRERFYNLTERYFQIIDTEKENFEKECLIPLFDGKADLKLIRKITKDRYVPEEQEDTFAELLKLLVGNKAKTNVIDENIPMPKDSMNIQDIKAADEGIDQFYLECIDLYDLAKVAQIMKSYDYLCEKAVDELDTYEKVISSGGPESDEYKKYMGTLIGKNNGKKHYRAWRNIENNYPNGLYVKEAEAILKKQQEFNAKITDDFILAVISILKARIPYYIGPLSSTGKNAWVTRDDSVRFEYSYEYTQKYSGHKIVNEEESIAEWKKRMISRCTYLPEEYALPKGSFLGETFSILNELNILSAYDKDGNEYFLTMNDKVKVFNDLFLQKKSVTYREVADVLDLESFGPKSGKREKPFNNTFTLYHRIAAVIPELKVTDIMDIFDEPEKIQKIEDIILALNLYDEPSTKKTYFEETMHFDPAVSSKLAQLKSESFYSFSRKFIFETVIDGDHGTLLSKMFEDNQKGQKNEQMTLITNAVGPDGEPLDFLSNKYVRKIKENNGELSIDLLIENGKPVIAMSRPVIRALNECMKMYTEMVKAYGVPERVIIETARDFKDHTEIKEEPEKHFKTMENLYQNLMQQIKEKKLYDSDKNIEDWEAIKQYLSRNANKIEYYIRQNGTDLLTGEKIDLNRLSDYEIDHILPRGFGDDSKDDKMLISRLANAKKGDRLPLEFIESGDTVGTIKMTSSEYEKRVRSLFECGMISEKKYKRLMLADTSELEGFINQNLVDTRYIIREFMSILRAYNTVHNYRTHVVALKSAYTRLYRKAFRMDKERDFGDQHHAHDAALLIIADRTLNNYYPNYDRHSHSESKSSFGSYKNFMKAMNESFGNNEEARKKAEDLNEFVRLAYYKAYDESSSDKRSLIYRIKDTVPFYSVKPEKNYKGKYFEVTVLDQTKYKEDAPLTIVGVNDNKKVFESVECAAVDFYKFTNAKGKKEHLAIHIPKVIISADGTIDQQKYLNLIRYHYKKPELINENGELKTYYFRFRAFRRDIIYDTESNCPVLFNIGSIVDKKLDKKFINVFSYNDISWRSSDIREKLTDRFNIKTYNNKDGNPFRELDKEKMVRYVNDTIWNNESITEKHIQTVIDKTSRTNNLNQFSDQLAFYELLLQRPEVPPTIDGQNRLVINSQAIKTNKNAQYIKLKYNILGVRFTNNENGKLIIETPTAVSGQFSKITHEPFSWNISRNLL